MCTLKQKPHEKKAEKYCERKDSNREGKQPEHRTNDEGRRKSNGKDQESQRYTIQTVGEGGGKRLPLQGIN